MARDKTGKNKIKGPKIKIEFTHNRLVHYAPLLKSGKRSFFNIKQQQKNGKMRE